MSDWIGLALIVLIVVGGIVASAKLSAPSRRISEAEFEQRAREGAAAKAGLFALQELLDPKAAKAVAVQKDLKHGYYNKKKLPGEGDDTQAVDAVTGDARLSEADETTDAEGRDA